MNEKSIRAILGKKLKQWVDSIQGTEVRKAVRDQTIVTGGSIVSMLLGEDVKDFDVYFRTKQAALLVAKHYVALWNVSHPNRKIEVVEQPDRVFLLLQSQGIVAEAPEVSEETTDEFEEFIADEAVSDEKSKFRPVFISSNALTLSDKIQIVVRFFGEPDEIHKNYDFVHCTNFWTSWDHKLTLRPDALAAIITKELRYVGSKYPLCSVIRTRKFIKRGWNINAGQYLKMIMQLSEINLKDPRVLEDQLVGVDSAYFQIVIDAVKANPERITASYLAEVIDRVFG